MAPDPLKTGPRPLTPGLPYSIPTLCNQEAKKPKLRNKVPSPLITLPKESLETPSVLPKTNLLHFVLLILLCLSSQDILRR